MDAMMAKPGLELPPLVGLLVDDANCLELQALKHPDIVIKLVKEVVPTVIKTEFAKVIVVPYSKYKEVQNIVEISGLIYNVLLVLVATDKVTERCQKVIGVHMLSPQCILNCLGTLQSEYTEFQDFLNKRTQYTFFNKANIPFLIKHTFSDSVFYPASPSTLTFSKLNAIYRAALLDPIFDNSADTIKTALQKLSKDTSTQSIIKSYIRFGLYKMLNYYLRHPHSFGYTLFKEYLDSLKYSLKIAYKPMKNYQETLYRGTLLRKVDVDEWRKCKGEHVLLSSFTSTAWNLSKAYRFFNKPHVSGFARVLFTIYLTKDSDNFCEFLQKILLVKTAGSMYPADLTQTMERQVLFPPLYPVKILKVREHKHADYDYEIILEAPILLEIK